MRINLTSVFVDDQDKALGFYTEVLGFEKKHDIPMGEDRWLTVVSPERPRRHRARAGAQRAPGRRPVQAGAGRRRHPGHLVRGRRRHAEHERLRGLGVRFTQPPAEMGPVDTAVLDDTCGNLIQIVSPV